MWHRKVLSSLVSGLVLIVLSGSCFGQDLTGEVRWSGKVELSESILVAPGATLTLAAGTQLVVKNPQSKLSVQGTLKVLGSKAAPVVFSSVAEWEGVELMEASPDSLFRWAVFNSAKSAITSFATDFRVENCTFEGMEFGIRLMRESSPVIVDSVFKDNQIGVANEMKSGAVIRRNRFIGQTRSAILASHNSTGAITNNYFEKNKQGIALLQRYTDRISKNRFVENETAIYCNQTQSSPLIEQNQFEKNTYGVMNFSFSYPTLKNNTFVDNKTAVHNDQYGSPLLENNLFRSNETALYNYRKSNPKVFLNSFEQNQLAMYCDFSSYPEVKNNNFLNNKLGVKLGIYQSADWERRSGSKKIMQRESAARKSQNPMLAKAPEKFNDFVDVSGNWWGDDTAQLEKTGPEGNAPLFHDRKDQPEVSYEDYGPGVYKLDWVDFAPWLEAPVKGAGLERTP